MLEYLLILGTSTWQHWLGLPNWEWGFVIFTCLKHRLIWGTEWRSTAGSLCRHKWTCGSFISISRGNGMCVQAMLGGQMMHHHRQYTWSCSISTLSERWTPNEHLAQWLCSNITHTHKNKFLWLKYGMHSNWRQAKVFGMTKGLFSFTSLYGIGGTNHRLRSVTSL